jgi:hypothetical protein
MQAVTDWHLMTIAEPELAHFEQDVLAIAAGLPPDANRHVVWARALKPRLRALVGFQARVACLQSPAAYDVAYDRLYGHLFDAVEITR